MQVSKASNPFKPADPICVRWVALPSSGTTRGVFKGSNSPR